MAIAHRATGTAVFGANDITPVIPGGAQAGDMMLLLVGGKPFNGSFGASMAPGWTALSVFTDGVVAAGVDVGSMQVTAWWKEHDGSEADPLVDEGATVWDVMGAIVMVFSKGSNDIWQTPVIVGGGDATAGTGFSVTAGSNPGVTAGDHCVSFAAFRSDAATPCSSHLTPTQTGSTFSNTHDPATDPETTTGGDMGMCITRSTLTGTGSAAPVMAATLAASHTGAAAFIRLRVNQRLDGALFSRAPSFPVGAASNVNQNLAGSLLSVAPSFPQGVVRPDQTLAGVLFSRGPTFPAGRVDLRLAGVLFSRAPSFPVGAVTSVSTLAGQLFSRAPSFPGGAVQQESLLGGVVFSVGPVFPTGAVSSVGGFLIIGARALGQFFRLDDRLHLAEIGRGRRSGFRPPEGWERASEPFMFDGDTTALGSAGNAMLIVGTAWLDHGSAPIATLRDAINQALDDAGYRTPGGEHLT